MKGQDDRGERNATVWVGWFRDGSTFVAHLKMDQGVTGANTELLGHEHDLQP